MAKRREVRLLPTVHEETEEDEQEEQEGFLGTFGLTLSRPLVTVTSASLRHWLPTISHSPEPGDT